MKMTARDTMSHIKQQTPAKLCTCQIGITQVGWDVHREAGGIAERSMVRSGPGWRHRYMHIDASPCTPSSENAFNLGCVKWTKVLLLRLRQ